MEYNSSYWFSQWEDALAEVNRIRKDIDLKTGENDKDKIELDPNRLKNAMLVEEKFWNRYQQAKYDEENSADSNGGLLYIGRSDYGC